MANPLFLCLDSAALLMLLQFYLLGQIQTSQTGRQPYSDAPPYGEWSLVSDLWLIIPTGLIRTN